MMIKSHPTVYGGVRFRSRLEATWAAFFDLANIKWDYEPVDLAGWAPDFALWLTEPVYVEVKPAPMVAAWGDGPVVVSTEFPGFDKARPHSADAWILLLGLRPNGSADYFGIGALLDRRDRFVEWHDMKNQIRVTNAEAKWNAAKAVTQWVPQ